MLTGEIRLINEMKRENNKGWLHIRYRKVGI